ncbi:MAG: PAS domain S-box protein [Anaerolineae bacterium]|nr:PAS domain S-box protein [Anaerolineae bacterium]
MDTTILLIDDDTRILETFSRVLKLAGYTVFAAENGEQGLALYYQENPDVVLLDVRMPGMGGLEALEIIRAHDPEANVILCTGHTDHDDVLEALRAGATDLLPKPVGQPELESALRRAEERIKLKRKLRASQEALRQQNEQLEALVQVRTQALTETVARLKESEERFREIYAESPIGIELYDVNGELVDINAACLDIFGASSIADVKGFKLFEDPNLPKAAKERLLQGETVQYETAFDFELVKRQTLYPTTRSGTIHIDVRITALGIEEGGPPSSYLVQVQDITERQQARQALQKSEQRMELALKGADLGTWDWNVQTGDVIFNARWAEMLGYTLEEIEPHIDTWAKLSHPDDMPEVMAALNAHLEGKTDVYKTRHRMQYKSGDWIWILDTGRVIERDADGNPVRACGTHLDITERVQAEKALRESEERYRLLAETTPDIIVLHDLEGRVVYLNRAGLDFAGLELSEAVGQPISAFISPDRLADLQARREQRLADDETSYRYETEFINQVGRRMLAEVHSTPILRDGHVSEILLVARDVTEHVQAEKALRESEEKYRALFNQSASGIHLHDFEGRMLDVNEMACAQLGYSREELLELTLFDFHLNAAGTVNLPKDEILRLWRVWQPGDRFTIEAEHRHKDGSVIPVEVSTGVIRYGDKVHILAIVQDITERKLAEAARERLAAQVHDQARHLQQVLTTVPEGVVLLDAEGHVMLANPVAERALAFLANTGTSSLDQPITCLGDRPLAELLTSPSTKGLWHDVKKAGRTFEVIARPMENGHESEDWVLLLRDVTQEREIQRHIQHQERLAAVGQLAAGIAHDFNNIIAVIVLYTQMVLSAPDVSSTHRQRLETVDQQAQQAAKLIEQILDFSRRTVLERRPMDLTPFLKEVIKLLERTVPENVEIGLSYGLDEYTVSADPTRMQQAILNLVVNARAAMPEGGELHIALSRAEAPDDVRCVSCGRVMEGEWVRIAVTDTGSGIPPDVLPHIFEPFFTTKEVGQGAGLGLPQVYGIVKQHEGHINVATQVGQGTTVTIYLPVLSAHQPMVSPVRPRSVVEGHGEIILVVEDNTTLRAALVESIAALNYRILEAANGHEALEILEQHVGAVSLVLSDLVMPKMGGQALFHAMSARGLHLPVVMLSGHPMEEELEDLKAQGLAGWMLKPPDMEKLSQLLAQVLGEAVEGER